ncbi:MAG: hypothetical protein ACE5GV_10380 [Candidatus Scalindua sp.]
MRALIVHDDPATADFFLLNLPRELDCQVTPEEKSVQEAIERIKSSKFDVYLIDLRLRNYPQDRANSNPRGGLEVIAALDDSQREKVILVTDYHDVPETARAITDAAKLKCRYFAWSPFQANDDNLNYVILKEHIQSIKQRLVNIQRLKKVIFRQKLIFGSILAFFGIISVIVFKINGEFAAFLVSLFGLITSLITLFISKSKEPLFRVD